MLTERLLDGAVEIEDQMKAIGHLGGVRSAPTDGLRIRPVPVWADDLDVGMLVEPRGHAIGRAHRQNVDHAPAFQIHEDGAVVMLAFLPRPVIDPEDPQGLRGGRRGRRPFQEAQNRVVADAHAQPIQQPFASPSAERIADQVHDTTEPLGVLHARQRHAWQSMSEDHGLTPTGTTAPPGDAHTQGDRLSRCRQVLERSPIAAMPTARGPTTRGATAGCRARGPRPRRHRGWS
jgi:hypothetical protein